MSNLTRSKHAVYRIFDAAGLLLYVGATSNPVRRFTLNHQYRAPWLYDAARIDLEWWPNLETALAAERAAIKTENPVYNQASKPILVCPKCKGVKDPDPPYCKPCTKEYYRLYYLRKTGRL